MCYYIYACVCTRMCARFLFIFKENEWRVSIQGEIMKEKSIMEFVLNCI